MSMPSGMNSSGLLRAASFAKSEGTEISDIRSAPAVPVS